MTIEEEAIIIRIKRFRESLDRFYKNWANQSFSESVVEMEDLRKLMLDIYVASEVEETNKAFDKMAEREKRRKSKKKIVIV